MAEDGPPPSLQKVRAACKKRGATGAKGLGRWFISTIILTCRALHSNENFGTFEIGVNGLEFSRKLLKF